MVFLTSFVFASGVSSPYWEGNPLKMAAGSTETVDLNLQNKQSNETINFKVEIKEGVNIAKLDQEVYVIGPEEDVNAVLKISIPNKAEQGAEYPIDIEFKTISSSEGENMITTQTGSDVEFKVIVSGKETNYIPYILGGLILIVLVIILSMPKKKKQIRKPVKKVAPKKTSKKKPSKKKSSKKKPSKKKKK